MEALKYVHGLKALDLGHNDITTLDWLHYCPDLELLILSDNWKIKDMTEIGALTHLQYLERFWGTRMYSLSEEEKERFIRVHDGVQISFNAKHQTSDGWREHERYVHYCWCLKHQEWIPFSEPIPEK